MRFTSTVPATLVLTLLAGCADRQVSELEPEQRTVESKFFPPTPEREIDILFVIDNSGSMAEEQSSLRANFGKFMDVLATIEGGMPDVHIGVATSSMGQSAGDGVAGGSFGSACAGSGDDGVLRTAPAISGRFIIDEAIDGGSRNRNYTGTLADAFSALADVGTGGCGIEQHLRATKRALSHPTNTGFLRPDAKLAVIYIADEDDCSLDHKALFDGTDTTAINFRCTSTGIECDGGGDLSMPGLRTNCRPKIDSPFLSEVDSYVDYLKSLKAAPNEDIVVAGIVGDPDPVEITQDAMGRSVLKPSCQYAGQNAYPAVRTSDFLSQFTYNVRETICEADLSRALVEVGAIIKKTLEDRCFEGELADVDLDTPGLQPDCAVSDYQRMPNGDYEERYVLPQCGRATGGAAAFPCWRIEKDDVNCFYTATQLELVVERGETTPPPGTRTKAACVTTDGSVR